MTVHVCVRLTHSWILIVLILSWTRDTRGGTWCSAALTGAAFQRRWTQKKGLSHSLFNWLHHWIIAKFFLGFSLVRTSRGTTSAIQRRAGRERQADSDREPRCDERERNTVVLSLNLNFRGKHKIERGKRERGKERGTHTHTRWGVCHSNLVPQGSTTQHYLKTGWLHWQKRCRRAVFWGFGSARDEDEGISLNQLACAVNLRHRAEGETDIWHRPGGRGTHTHAGKTLLPCSCASKKKILWAQISVIAPFFCSWKNIVGTQRRQTE